jgi:hypothetical protein
MAPFSPVHIQGCTKGENRLHNARKITEVYPSALNPLEKFINVSSDTSSAEKILVILTENLLILCKQLLQLMVQPHVTLQLVCQVSRISGLVCW